MARQSQRSPYHLLGGAPSLAEISFLLHTTLPGATLLGALIFAPWFWGCTWPLGIHLLDILLLAATASWSIGLFLRQRGSGLPGLLLCAVIGLLAQGWLVTLNARSACDPATDLFTPVSARLAWLPGSIDQSQSREQMPRVSGLLGAVVIAAWLGWDRAWRRRILWTLTGTGLSIALLGCWQRWTQATDIFWNSSRHLDFFFATYRNVTNAGEYLNLVLPVAAALTLVASLKLRHPARLAVGGVASLLLFTGSIVSGSKLASLVTVGNLALFIILNRGYLLQQFAHVSVPTRLATLLILLLLAAIIIPSAGLDVAQNRWSRFFENHDGSATLRNRLQVDEACALAAPDAGLTGFGPGTFRAIFPYYSQRVAGDLTGVWSFAHDDYAQTLLEWGVIGTALWGVLSLGGFTTLVRFWRSRDGRTEDRICAVGLMQGLLATGVAAAVDFPLQIASIQVAIAVLLGLAWSSGEWVRGRS